MPNQFEAFQIHILEEAADVYPVVARGSEDVTVQAAIPSEQVAGLEAEHWLERSQSDRTYLRELGNRLFRILFSGEVLLGFQSSLAAARAQGLGLRIVLTLDAPELARLPWELVYSGRFEGFLARSAATPIVRHLSSPNPARPPIEGDALRTLLVVAEPRDLPALSRNREEVLAIVQSLSGGKGGAQVDVLENATLPKLKDILREAEQAERGYHIFHFVGHGASDEQGGQLLFEDQDRYAAPVSAEQVAELLDDTSVNLVFLNACASARGGAAGLPFYPFQGVAQACINLGVRAALAMQVEVVDTAAGDFAREFYASLADGEEVEKALLDARHLVGKADAADWAVPVLYSRVLEGSILAPQIPRPARTPGEWVQHLLDLVGDNPWAVLLFSILSLLALILGLSVDVREARQPGGLLYALWPAATATPAPLPPMGGGFNVAVAEFGALDETGQLTVTQESWELSTWLYQAIKAERDRLPAAQTFEIRGPEQVRAVLGKDAEARAADAKRVAGQHNATLLIYGLVIGGDGSYHVEPEFYVSDAAFGYGSEVAGPDRLGLAVPFEPPLDQPGTLGGINETLDARVRALRHLVDGLGLYYLERYQEAWAAFRQAALVDGWLDREGKEVVYLLMGAARLKLYDTQEPDVEHLRQAADSFAKALELNQAYARSYLGLGSVALLQAVRDEETGVDEEKLLEARKWYSDSLDVPDQPGSAYVPVKAYFGLGQVYLKGHEHRLPGWSGEQARRYLERVIAAYEETPTQDLVWFAGHAHALLGRLAGDVEDWAGMSSACREAISLLSTLPDRSQQVTVARYWTWVAFAEEQQGQLDAARDAYWQAIQVGQNAVSPAEVGAWQSELDRLEKGVP